jgi:hypothetical protein
MTLLCDWCQYTPGFYTDERKCGEGYTELKGRDEDCACFAPTSELVGELADDKRWREFVQFYGEPNPHIALLLRARAKANGGLTELFNKHLKTAAGEGYDNTGINQLGGCTNRKVVLTEAEGEAGKRLFKQVMDEKLWDLVDSGGPGWLFGSPETMKGIGLIPSKLARERLGLNRHNWHLYQQIT